MTSPRFPTTTTIKGGRGSERFTPEDTKAKVRFRYSRGTGVGSLAHRSIIFISFISENKLNPLNFQGIQI